MCCITTFGLYPRGRMINLKLMVELTGFSFGSNPTASKSLLLIRFILFIFFLIVLIIGNDESSDYALEQLFSSKICSAVIAVYLFYLFIMIIISLLMIFNENIFNKQFCQNVVVQVIYDMCTRFIIPFALTTALQIWISDVIIYGADGLYSGIELIVRISMFLIIIEPILFSLIQFHYFSGLCGVIGFNVFFIILFEFAVRPDADNTNLISFYFVWIILCIVWHLFITNLNNWRNYQWFTSQNIAINCNKYELLATNSCNEINKYKEKLGNAGNKKLMIKVWANEDKQAIENKNDDDEYCTIVMGSCTDQRRKTIATYQSLHREYSDLVLLLGDNIYADLAPPTCTKWWTKVTCQTRDFKEEYDVLLNHKDFQPSEYKNQFKKQLWLALWDDHDYGANDADKDYEDKYIAKKAFIEWFEIVNKKTGGMPSEINNQVEEMKDQKERGLWYYYDYKYKNITFRIIMLDTRFYRKEDEDILGDEQWKWLDNIYNDSNLDDIDWFLLGSGSPLLNEGFAGKKTVGDHNRTELFKILNKKKEYIPKTIILSGDLHYSVWHSYNDQLYELTTSSLTHSQYWWCGKKKLKLKTIDQYDHKFASIKSEICKKTSYGVLKISKNQFHFCIKDAFGYSYLNVSHKKGSD